MTGRSGGCGAASFSTGTAPAVPPGEIPAETASAAITGPPPRRRACRRDQAVELGGHVRKGEAGELVVYANRITRTETDAEGEVSERKIPFLKGYTVFNAEQCEGLPAHYYARAETPALTPMQRRRW